jgi:hypothetical protein
MRLPGPDGRFDVRDHNRCVCPCSELGMTALEDFTNEFIETNNFKLLEDPTSLDVLLQRFTTEIFDPNDIFDVANVVNDDLQDPCIFTIHIKVVFNVILAAFTNRDSDPEIFRIYHEAVRY